MTKPLTDVLAEALRDLVPDGDAHLATIPDGEPVTLVCRAREMKTARAALARYEAEKAAPKCTCACRADFTPVFKCAVHGPKAEPQEEPIPSDQGDCPGFLWKADPQPAPAERLDALLKEAGLVPRITSPAPCPANCQTQAEHEALTAPACPESEGE